MRVVTFGEIMLRLATPARLRFSQAKELELTYGGGEANVAVSLANFGFDASFVTRLPRNPFGDGAINVLRGFGAETTFIPLGAERVAGKPRDRRSTRANSRHKWSSVAYFPLKNKTLQ